MTRARVGPGGWSRSASTRWSRPRVGRRGPAHRWRGHNGRDRAATDRYQLHAV